MIEARCDGHELVTCFHVTMRVDANDTYDNVPLDFIHSGVWQLLNVNYKYENVNEG